MGELQEVFSQDTADGWLRRLRAHGVPASPVRSVAEAFATEDYRSRTVAFDHPDFGEVRSPGPLVQPEEPVPARRAPALGEHTLPVPTDIAGMSSEEIERLTGA